MDRIVDIATDGLHLSAHRGFLIVSEERREVGRIPLDDVYAVIVHAHGVTWTTNLAVALAERGALLLLCGPNHAPVAVCLPLEGHHAQNARIRAQLDAGRPLLKQLWRQVVVAKISWQGAVLDSCGIPAAAFDLLARKVRSGDPENVEAQAARRYWPLLMGEAFRRDREADGVNALLNYGYTVLRPLVDALALRLVSAGIETVTPQAKRAFAGLIALDLPVDGGTTTVAGAAQRTAQTLATAFQAGRSSELVLPRPPSRLELAGLGALLR